MMLDRVLPRANLFSFFKASCESVTVIDTLRLLVGSFGRPMIYPALKLANTTRSSCSMDVPSKVTWTRSGDLTQGEYVSFHRTSIGSPDRSGPPWLE